MLHSKRDGNDVLPSATTATTSATAAAASGKSGILPKKLANFLRLRQQSLPSPRRKPRGKSHQQLQRHSDHQHRKREPEQSQPQSILLQPTGRTTSPAPAHRQQSIFEPPSPIGIHRRYRKPSHDRRRRTLGESRTLHGRQLPTIPRAVPTPTALVSTIGRTHPRHIHGQQPSIGLRHSHIRKQHGRHGTHQRRIRRRGDAVVVEGISPEQSPLQHLPRRAKRRRERERKRGISRPHLPRRRTGRQRLGPRPSIEKSR
mmetsp:Transcript_3997/g.8597  ORF Transcript_3997/g.8597 Transcript_3997/m.8597 type:complete len:258 (-) Transcript_3997:552-1325(-)